MADDTTYRCRICGCYRLSSEYDAYRDSGGIVRRHTRCKACRRNQNRKYRRRRYGPNEGAITLTPASDRPRAARERAARQAEQERLDRINEVAYARLRENREAACG